MLRTLSQQMYADFYKYNYYHTCISVSTYSVVGRAVCMQSRKSNVILSV